MFWWFMSPCRYSLAYHPISFVQYRMVLKPFIDCLIIMAMVSSHKSCNNVASTPSSLLLFLHFFVPCLNITHSTILRCFSPQFWQVSAKKGGTSRFSADTFFQPVMWRWNDQLLTGSLSDQHAGISFLTQHWVFATRFVFKLISPLLLASKALRTC